MLVREKKHPELPGFNLFPAKCPSISIKGYDI
jgi:hypothetical protein